MGQVQVAISVDVSAFASFDKTMIDFLVRFYTGPPEILIPCQISSRATQPVIVHANVEPIYAGFWLCRVERYPAMQSTSISLLVVATEGNLVYGAEHTAVTKSQQMNQSANVQLDSWAFTGIA